MSSPPPPIVTPFTEMFTLRYPVVCAPMFLVSNTEMVVAASEAGGLGAIPVFNYRPLANFILATHTIKKRTTHAFAVNLIIQGKNYHEQLDALIVEKVPLLIVSLGNPQEVIRRAHQANIKVFCDVATRRHAHKALDADADGLVAVASGAGGHGGNISSFALIPSLTSITSKPVLASGCISDGRGMLAAMALGASGVYLGTRFIASAEAQVSDDYKQAILNAEAEDIVSTKRVDGYPGNFIKNKALTEFGIEPTLWELILEKNKTIKRALAQQRAKATILANASRMKKISYKTVYAAGQGVGMIKKILPIREIIYSTVKEYQELKTLIP